MYGKYVYACCFFFTYLNKKTPKPFFVWLYLLQRRESMVAEACVFYIAANKVRNYAYVQDVTHAQSSWLMCKINALCGFHRVKEIPNSKETTEKENSVQKIPIDMRHMNATTNTNILIRFVAFLCSKIPQIRNEKNAEFISIASLCSQIFIDL